MKSINKPRHQTNSAIALSNISTVNHTTSTSKIAQNSTIRSATPRRLARFQQAPVTLATPSRSTHTSTKSAPTSTTSALPTTARRSKSKQMATTPPAKPVWTHPGDLVTTRTAVSLQELYDQRVKDREQLQFARQQADTPLNVPPTLSRQHIPDWFVCDHCLLHNAHCVCDEFPDRQTVTDKLATLLDVVVYAHTNEVLELSSSNTARFLPRHGAYSVIMGDYRGEAILKNLIMSRPRDSVFVLFPSPTSITPDDFMNRFNTVLETTTATGTSPHPFPHYPPFTPDQLAVAQQRNTAIDARPMPQPAAQDNDEAEDADPSAPTDPAGAQKRGRRRAHRKQKRSPNDPLRLEIIQRQLEHTYYEHDLDELVDDRINAIIPTFSSTRDFYQTKDEHYQQYKEQNPTANTTKPLVIVLDGTWGNAKALDRRLTLIINEVFEKNAFNERDLLVQPIPSTTSTSITPPADATTDATTTTTNAEDSKDSAPGNDDGAKAEDGESKELPSYLKDMVIPEGHQLVNPKTYLHRVRVTRAIRGDIGQLRRLQSSERAVVTSSALEVNRTYWPQLRNESDDPAADGAESATQTSTTTTTTADVPPTLQTATDNEFILSLPQGTPIKTQSVLIADDMVLEDNSGGRVSTLHAFLVMLEELYDLPVITSHRDLDIEKYKSQLKRKDQQVVLELVESFATILQTMVIGYHTARGLQKAQLLDPETRQKVKERYQKFLEKKEADKKQRTDWYRANRDQKQLLSAAAAAAEAGGATGDVAQQAGSDSDEVLPVKKQKSDQQLSEEDNNLVSLSK